MTPCQRPDISERLMMALSPAEFPEEASEIEEHAKQCSSCRHELADLRQLESVIKEQKEQLAEAVRPCPDPEMLFNFATGEKVLRNVGNHIELCADCAEQVSLIRELKKENLDSSKTPVPRRTGELIHAAVRQEYGQARRPNLRTIRDLLSALTEFFHFPSLALGAAVAALLLLLVLPYKPEGLVLSPAFSSVSWQVASLASKGTAPKSSLVAKQKVALIILLPRDIKLSSEEIDKIYADIALASKLGGFYNFISPGKLKVSLKDQTLPQNSAAVAEVAAGKTGANYVLIFEILPSKSGYTLVGRLYKRAGKEQRGSISQTGLPLSAIPSRITGIGAELLLEAESS